MIIFLSPRRRVKVFFTIDTFIILYVFLTRAFITRGQKRVSPKTCNALFVERVEVARCSLGLQRADGAARPNDSSFYNLEVFLSELANCPGAHWPRIGNYCYYSSCCVDALSL